MLNQLSLCYLVFRMTSACTRLVVKMLALVIKRSTRLVGNWRAKAELHRLQQLPIPTRRIPEEVILVTILEKPQWVRLDGVEIACSSPGIAAQARSHARSWLRTAPYATRVVRVGPDGIPRIQATRGGEDLAQDLTSHGLATAQGGSSGVTYRESELLAKMRHLGMWKRPARAGSQTERVT